MNGYTSSIGSVATTITAIFTDCAGNTGPGAVPAGEESDGRPQLTDDEAVSHTREAYLSGADDWTPWV